MIASNLLSGLNKFCPPPIIISLIWSFVILGFVSKATFCPNGNRHISHFWRLSGSSVAQVA